MRETRLWEIRPFVGSIVAIAGVAVLFGGLLLAFREGLRGATFDMGGIGEAIGIQFRIIAGDPPDLDVAPGASGYHDSLRTVGPQGHYHAKATDRTTIGAGVPLGSLLFRVPVAEYDGPPSRDVAPERLRPIACPFAVAHVSVVDAEGRRRGRAAVSWKSETGHGTAWGEEGEVEVLLAPGTFALGVDGEGEPRHVVTLAAGETVWCTLRSDGLVIDCRETR